MIVKQYMTANPITVTKEATVEDAIQLLKTNFIRHLPVVENDRLIGWLTDANLRGALFPSMLEEITIKDIMIHDPITVEASESIEAAARLLVKNRIGGMPVIENEQLVGVITVIDLLNAFLEMLGILQSSSRIDVKPRSTHGAIDSISSVIEREGSEIISVCLVPQKCGDGQIYSFRLGRCDAKKLVEELEKEGHEVISYSTC
ncbi:MAG: signal transduction protein [Deltaproteobacteria bacterium]|nr:MAG: signal transduction protein [Deltaproteobacteria bacterium]